MCGVRHTGRAHPQPADAKRTLPPWQGAGLATPEFEDASLNRAVKWALGSATRRAASLTVLVCPAGKAWKDKGFYKLLSVPRRKVCSVGEKFELMAARWLMLAMLIALSKANDVDLVLAHFGELPTSVIHRFAKQRYLRLTDGHSSQLEHCASG